MQQLEYAAAVAVWIVIPSTAPVSRQSGGLHRRSVSVTLSEFICLERARTCGDVPACSPPPECVGLSGAARGGFSLKPDCCALDMTWPVVSLRHCKDARILCTITHLAVSVHVRCGQALLTGVCCGWPAEPARSWLITALQCCRVPASWCTDSMQDTGSDAGALYGALGSSCTVGCLTSCTCFVLEPDIAMQACVVAQQDHCGPPMLCFGCLGAVFGCIKSAGECCLHIALSIAFAVLVETRLQWHGSHCTSTHCVHSICCSSMPLQLAQSCTWAARDLFCNRTVLQ